MILHRVSSFFAKDRDILRSLDLGDSPWRNEVALTVAAYGEELTTDRAIAAIQRGTRLLRIFTAGLGRSAALHAALADDAPPSWSAFTEPPAPRPLQDRLAAMLYIVGQKSDVPLLELGDQTRYIGARLFERCVAQGLDFDVAVSDESFFNIVMNHADEAGLNRLAESFLLRRAGITTRIIATHNLPVREPAAADPEKARLYRTLLKPYRERVLGGRMRSVLTSIPTTRDSDVDGIDYDAYTTLYFRMCDQPWAAIKAAQYRLIETLDSAKSLRFTNTDGTDLSMTVDGFTFCNSVIARNIPGSEVFSAPALESTTGLVVAKGRFAAKDEARGLMENLTLRFENGLLIEARAETGQAHLDRALETDEGARRIGEIGIGTNPYLKRHVSSILLAEKIGGSFHIALGDAYTMTDYMGDPVRVDNGNRSALHWDITTMLYGKGGRILADGLPVMADGVFTDPALDVLNRGWAALPFEDRPPEWQAIYPNG